jgi:hypothetical protein
MRRLDFNKKKRRGGRSDSPYSVFHGGVAQYLSTRFLLLRRVFVTSTPTVVKLSQRRHLRIQ